jgi:pheromone shutdown protein TraB
MTRILLVVIFANIGSIIGTYLGGIGILRIFHQLFMQ